MGKSELRNLSSVTIGCWSHPWVGKQKKPALVPKRIIENSEIVNDLFLIADETVHRWH